MPASLDPHGCRRASRILHAPADAVWAVVSDGWLYANWVVGTSRVRAVDPGWPLEGSRIHHSFGVWPAVIDDVTVSLEAVPSERLHLQAKGWPLGEAQVELSIIDGAVDTCTVTIIEDVVTGPGLLVPRVVRQVAIAARNKEALGRLAFIAEGRHRHWTGEE